MRTIDAILSGASVSFSVKNGRPDDLIIGNAARDENTLIVMATHDRSGMQCWLLGSVAERVVRHSGDPMLIIRAS